MAQQNAVDFFQYNIDNGKQETEESTQYDSVNQLYTLRLRDSIVFDNDEFHFPYNKFHGDFMLTANFAFMGHDSISEPEIGWMVRKTDKDNSFSINLGIQGKGQIFVRCCLENDDTLIVSDSLIPELRVKYQILQLERKRNQIILRAAIPGEPLQQIGFQNFGNLTDELVAGIYLISQDSGIIEEGRVWNIRIDKPVDGNYNPEKSGWLGCRLETMNVYDGERKVIFTKPDRFEAPNWMPDGEKLLFNMNGLLYKIPIQGGEPELINTDYANQCNNDHGISFDGKLLAISHHAAEANGQSAVYVLPLEGGTPKLITSETPSYWHGWSPTNKEVAYIAKRYGKSGYNIFSKNIEGGEEVPLTTTKEGEHVDGCEYSPDGKSIYYNGSQTGNMQIWRMNTDGTNNEQLTFDEYKNWFPHISPDGKWIVFLSFPADIPLNDHPSYKHVMLRLMLVAGGEPKVIAWLFGGQGTINVPSWSPDSKQIAFVSNYGK